MKERKEYPTLTIRVSNEHKKMLSELRNKYYINVSKIFRDAIESLYKKIKDENCEN